MIASKTTGEGQDRQDSIQAADKPGRAIEPRNLTMYALSNWPCSSTVYHVTGHQWPTNLLVLQPNQLEHVMCLVVVHDVETQTAVAAKQGQGVVSGWHHAGDGLGDVHGHQNVPGA